MRIKQVRKISALMLGATVVALLSACSGSNNPLKTAEPKAAAKFLVSASQAAEQKLHVFNAPGGYYYGECMNGKANKTLCHQLYKVMVSYASKSKQFQGITVSDLTDQGVFKHIKTDYQREQFNAI